MPYLPSPPLGPVGPQTDDPYQSFNRKTHSVNKGLDRYALRPASKVYDAVLPDAVEIGVSNVASNLSLPGAVVNNILQGDVAGAGTNTFRALL